MVLLLKGPMELTSLGFRLVLEENMWDSRMSMQGREAWI